MEAYGQKIVRLAYTYLKNEQLAEDAAQEVFIKCYEKFHTFRHQSSYQTWLYTITVNVCKDRLRSWSFRHIFIHPFLANASVTEKTPESDIIGAESKRELSERVLQLPVKYREVIILFYYEDLSYEDMMELLDVSYQTVKSRLHRARQLLKKKLEGGHWHERSLEKFEE